MGVRREERITMSEGDLARMEEVFGGHFGGGGVGWLVCLLLTDEVSEGWWLTGVEVGWEIRRVKMDELDSTRNSGNRDKLPGLLLFPASGVSRLGILAGDGKLDLGTFKGLTLEDK